MKQEALSYFNHAYLTVGAMLLFLTVFLGVLIYTFRKNGKGYYDKLSQLPLEENGLEGVKND